MSYRYSHLQKGTDYDQCLALEPFSAYMTKMEEKIVPKLVARLFKNKIPRYLDFACGTGRITKILAPLAEVSYGVDISETMIDQAKAKCPNTMFIVGDFTQRDLGIEPVDLVSAFRFLGNAEDELRTQALWAINKALVDGGYLVLNNHRNPRSIQYILYRLTGGEPDMDLTHSSLKRFLRQAGFEVVRARGVALWVIRHAFCRREILESGMALLFEPLSVIPGMAAICPDILVVAKKVRSV